MRPIQHGKKLIGFLKTLHDSSLSNRQRIALYIKSLRYIRNHWKGRPYGHPKTRRGFRQEEKIFVPHIVSTVRPSADWHVLQRRLLRRVLERGAAELQNPRRTALLLDTMRDWPSMPPARRMRFARHLIRRMHKVFSQELGLDPNPPSVVLASMFNPSRRRNQPRATRRFLNTENPACYFSETKPVKSSDIVFNYALDYKPSASTIFSMPLDSFLRHLFHEYAHHVQFALIQNINPRDGEDATTLARLFRANFKYYLRPEQFGSHAYRKQIVETDAIQFASFALEILSPIFGHNGDLSQAVEAAFDKIAPHAGNLLGIEAENEALNYKNSILDLLDQSAKPAERGAIASAAADRLNGLWQACRKANSKLRRHSRLPEVHIRTQMEAYLQMFAAIARDEFRQADQDFHSTNSETPKNPRTTSPLTTEIALQIAAAALAR